MTRPVRPPAAEIEVGSILDRYEIVQHVARGGMGSVWRARFSGKHGFTRQVAVKTILPELADNPAFHAMFLEEARISSKLVHANVAQVLDVGEHGSGVYIVFEWVDGRSLEELCEGCEASGGRLPLAIALRAVADASAGLHAAHELVDDAGKPLGIIHRDVTPNNILVSEKGVAKVIDFGIAKARDRVIQETRSGMVKGTPRYMSPEAACRREIDRRADVWSLGAVLFRAISGAPPFRDESGLLDFIDGVSGLPSLPLSAPAEVRALVKRALALSPAARFESADELRVALERALQATETSPADIAKTASDLLRTHPTSVRAPDPFAATAPPGRTAPVDAVTAEASPSVEPSASGARAGRAEHATTLASAGQGRKPLDSTRMLVAALVVAGAVTTAAAALVLCG